MLKKLSGFVLIVEGESVVKTCAVGHFRIGSGRLDESSSATRQEPNLKDHMATHSGRGQQLIRARA